MEMCVHFERTKPFVMIWYKHPTFERKWPNFYTTCSVSNAFRKRYVTDRQQYCTCLTFQYTKLHDVSHRLSTRLARINEATSTPPLN
jgi:hypothetical protein